MAQMAEKIRKTAFFYWTLKMLYADILVIATQNCKTEARIKNIGFEIKTKTIASEALRLRVEDGGGFGQPVALM